MLTLRNFARPATYFRKIHYSVPSRTEEWTQPPQETPALDSLVDISVNTPSTNRASAPAVQQPYQIFESWKPDTFYSPLDFLRSRRIIARKSFSTRPSVGPGAKEALRNDAFRQLDIDPIVEVNNTVLLSNFITRMGKIRPRAQTGLSWRSQRMVARAIKRAKQKGILAILNRSSPQRLS